MFWIDLKATCCLIMHYIYNNNVFEIEGRSWSLTHLNQFERWWLYGCYWVVFYGFYHQIGGFGGARIFPFILKEIWSQKNSCNMFLMLKLTSKNLCLVLCFIGHEECVVIVEEYDKRVLYPMLINAIIIYILCHNFKLVVQTQWLRKIAIWIF